ncbi:MAG: GNAT family N-acetyltransferase [Lachnospiraceae bacterium]|nr:GNAT family N-acetyltransferase [Lachnospiraceae bacterium]
MSDDIRKIEDLSLNAWPSWQMQFYDGWILRYSAFYTHRTNCVEQLGFSCIPVEEKVACCEEIYRHWQTPCIFKISPIGDPFVDGYLENRGYHIEHHTTVMTRSLDDFTEAALTGHADLRVENRVSADWINTLFDLKRESSPLFRKIVPSMYAAIPMDEVAVTAVLDGKNVGTGLGILDRDTIGIYAIHVAEDARRKGIASDIVSTILAEGKKRGAQHAYLQVVTDNAPAVALYRRLGLRRDYCYWFRVKEV